MQDIVNGVFNGITDFFGSLGSGILDILINMISVLVNIIVFPINSLISFLFPSFSQLIVNFNNGIALFVSAPIGYIMYHIPPITRVCILTYLTFFIGYYSIIWTYRALIIVPHVIKKIKFW